MLIAQAADGRKKELELFDVVYGFMPLPGQPTTFMKHYGIVLGERVADQKVLARILLGTSKHIPAHQDGLLPGEFVVQDRNVLTALGLRVPTLFKAATHQVPVSSEDVARLWIVGSVLESKPTVRQLLRALRSSTP